MDENDICIFTGKPRNCARCGGNREDWTGLGDHINHMGHSVSGPIARNKKRDWAGMAKYMTKKDGSKLTGEEIQIEFMKYHAKGYETIPFSECDRWCYKNGCQGHAKQAKKEEEDSHE